MKSRSHRLPTISDTPDDWVDESWTVDCVCGVNFDDGEEMVDCDECGVWVHTRCSRYVKSEKLFACDKCKSKKLRKESEETEVAQLLVELPTKTLRMDNPYPMNCPSQNPYQVWSDIPMEEKVHVQGIPGGDPALFCGVSSVFNPNLWKSTGYVPKKFNYQYREFPCWDKKHDDDDDDDDNDDDNDDGKGKGKEELEKNACKGADALFSLSKENSRKPQANGGGTLDMGPPSADTNKQERQHIAVRKERSLLKPLLIHSLNQKKDDSKVFKDLNRKKNAKSLDKEGDSKKKDLHSVESVSTTSSDAKQSESNEGKGHNVFKTDKQHENLRVDVQANLDNNNTIISSGQPLENVQNPLEEAKQMEENDANQAPQSVEISPRTEDDMASSVKPNPVETIAMKDEVVPDIVDGTNDNGKSSSRSNGTRSNEINNLEKDASSSQPIEAKPIEISHPENTCSPQNDLTSDTKLDTSKSVNQNTIIPDDPSSASIEAKKEALSVSVPQINKSPNVDHSQTDEPEDEQPCGPTKEVPESSNGPLKLHGTVTSPTVASNQRKTIVAKSKPSIQYKSRSSSDSGKHKDNNNNSKSKKENNNNNNSSEVARNGDVSEKPRKVTKDLPKSSSTSALKSSHFSKSFSKKNSSDSKDPAVLSSSKTSSVQKKTDSGDSASSLRCENGVNEQNKTSLESSHRGEKMNQLNRQPVPKSHLPHVHPPGSTNSPSTLSDEELALLLHQELNSSPRVPRVPRMRHAGSLPQLASTTSTSTLMKRTSSSGGKDNGLVVSRKRNKDLSNKDNSREFEGAKKADRLPSIPSSRRHDLAKNGSAKVTHNVDKNAPPASTTASSGPSSSNEANEQNSRQSASDAETGAVAHRTLPGLIAEIMSKGKRMTYEELCNAVLPHWPNLRKHNGERYAYSSHSQAVLDCLRNRSEWSRLVDRGPKTNAGRKRRKSEADAPNPESEDDYSTDRNTKEVADNQRDEFPKGKRKARKQRRLALQGRGVKDVRRRRKAEVLSEDIDSSSSDSSEESAFSDEEMQEGGTSVANEASASSDEMGITS